MLAQRGVFIVLAGQGEAQQSSTQRLLPSNLRHLSTTTGCDARKWAVHGQAHHLLGHERVFCLKAVVHRLLLGTLPVARKLQLALQRDLNLE